MKILIIKKTNKKVQIEDNTKKIVQLPSYNSWLQMHWKLKKCDGTIVMNAQ